MKKWALSVLIAGFLVSGLACQQAGNVQDIQKKVNDLAAKVAQLEQEVMNLKSQVSQLTQGEEQEEGMEMEEHKGTSTKPGTGTHRPPAKKKTK